MAKNQKEKPTGATSKSFMTVGPTLHYSHANVYGCWVLGVIAFATTCLFWSKIQTGSFLSFNLDYVTCPEFYRLGRFVLSPLSIFEYPEQILVLGLLMGIIAVVPPLTSQLLSFRYTIPLVLAIAFFAGLPLFSVVVLLSCVASACRPLRFRSRIIAIALCIAPQLVYWAYFGGAKGVEPLRWGLSFVPWITAGFAGLGIAGFVLGIGHFTRYRPGLVWIFTALTLGAAFLIFETKVGFAELDYQLYIAKNNPEEVPEFYDHSITKALDETITDPLVKRYLAGFFYPTEPILLREELKREIQMQLAHDHWPNWLLVPDELKYQSKRQQLLAQYELFISRRPISKRMPTALYYKALLTEYSPDIRLLGQKEILRFHSDYPHRSALPIWYRLYEEFGQSDEALEARWRIAMHLAGQGKFDKADELAFEAEQIVEEILIHLDHMEPSRQAIRTAFETPAETAMTRFKFNQLYRNLVMLRNLISEQNRTSKDDSRKRLAKLVMLNPYSMEYPRLLEEILAEMKGEDRLLDNVLLAKTMLIEDAQRRAERLSNLSERFATTDGGVRARYELAVLKVRLYNEQKDANIDDRKVFLAQARSALVDFMEMYPRSIFAEQALAILENLPMVD